MGKRWRFWLGILISALFLTYALRGQHLGDVWKTLRQANYWWLVPGVAIYFVAVWVRTWRWHYMLRPIKSISLSRLFPIVTIGYMGNNIYPVRAGEVLRSYVLKRREDVSISASLATVVVERLFDGVAMLFFVFATLPFASLGRAYEGPVILFSILFFGALALFFGLAVSPKRAQRWYTYFVDRIIPLRFRPLAHRSLDKFMTGLASLRSKRDVFMIFSTSVIIWLLETGKYWFVMHAFSILRQFLCAHVNDGGCQPGDDNSVGPWLCGNVRCSGYPGAGKLWCGRRFGNRLHACPSCGAVATDNPAGHVLYGARKPVLA